MQHGMQSAENSKAQQEGRGLGMNGTRQEKVYGLETRCRLSALAMAHLFIKGDCLTG